MNYTVPTTVLVVVGLSEADLVLSNKKPTIRPVVGGFIIGIFLYALEELDTRLGTLFAALVVVTTLLTHGKTVFNAIGGKTL